MNATNLLGSILIALATNSNFVILETTNGPMRFERRVVTVLEGRVKEIESFHNPQLLPRVVDNTPASAPTNLVKMFNKSNLFNGTPVMVEGKNKK